MHARTPAAHIRSYESENHALHLLDDDDAQRSLSRRRRALPVLLLASLVAGLFTIALTQHLLAEAEQQARMEKVISDIQGASARPAASTQDELERVQPLAEAPTSETLRAFQKLSVPTIPLKSATPARARINMAQPSRGNAAHKSQPAARAVAKTTPLPRATSRPKSAEPKIDPSLSDDPLRDL